MIEFNGRFVNAAHIEDVCLSSSGKKNTVIMTFPRPDTYISQTFDTPGEAKAELDRLVKAIDAETIPGVITAIGDVVRQLRRGRQ